MGGKRRCWQRVATRSLERKWRSLEPGFRFSATRHTQRKGIQASDITDKITKEFTSSTSWTGEWPLGNLRPWEWYSSLRGNRATGGKEAWHLPCRVHSLAGEMKHSDPGVLNSHSQSISGYVPKRGREKWEIGHREERKCKKDFMPEGMPVVS